MGYGLPAEDRSMEDLMAEFSGDLFERRIFRRATKEVGRRERRNGPHVLVDDGTSRFFLGSRDRYRYRYIDRYRFSLFLSWAGFSWPILWPIRLANQNPARPLARLPPRAGISTYVSIHGVTNSSP
jgi:hypothetical protein